jgi:hypothetical protein
MFAALQVPRAAASSDAALLYTLLTDLRSTQSPARPAVSRERIRRSEPSVTERLYDVLANAKVMTSQISMHLSAPWRRTLFEKLDELLDPSDWHEDAAVLDAASYETFLRFLTYINPTRQPVLGLSDEGNFLAAWIDGPNRLTLEFLSKDLIRWVLVRHLDDDEQESAAAQVPLLRLSKTLEAYQPERWFFDGVTPDR